MTIKNGQIQSAQDRVCNEDCDITLARGPGSLSPQLSWQQFSWSVSSPRLRLRLSQKTASEGSGGGAELNIIVIWKFCNVTKYNRTRKITL